MPLAGKSHQLSSNNLAFDDILRVPGNTVS
jgi:hypothetical protein